MTTNMSNTIGDDAAVLQLAVETCRPFIDEQGHKLSFDLPSQPICLNADPTRLAQVLANMIEQ